MYLNVNGQVGTNGVGSHCNGEDNACTTPEIISSLITLGTAPMPGLSDDSSNGGTMSESAYLTLTSQHDLSAVPLQGYGCGTPVSPQLHQQCYQTPVSPAMSNSSFSSQRSSPMCSSPPSIRTHLIKESLKVTIQNKRWANGQAIPHVDSTVSSIDELTPEDEERRRRRRERNKVAATKCRNKKKERTLHLMGDNDDRSYYEYTVGIISAS